MADLNKKSEPDYGYNTLGKETKTGTNASIGMPDQVEEYQHEAPAKMRRGKEPQIFDNNGGNSKGDAGGVVNKNAEYGPVTYGF